MGKNSNTTNNNSSQSEDYNERLKHLFESRPDIVDKSFNKPLDYSKLDYGLSGSEYYRRFGKYYDGLDKLRKEEHEKEKKAEVKKKQSKETRRSAIKYILIYSIAFIGLILAIAIIGQSFDKAGMGGIFRLFFPGE